MANPQASDKCATRLQQCGMTPAVARRHHEKPAQEGGALFRFFS
jgi:hypothetical protein